MQNPYYSKNFLKSQRTKIKTTCIFGAIVLKWDITIKLLSNQKEDFTMARLITDECVSCGTCEAECPVGAIAEGDGKYVVDADACIDCGACEGACPTGAIVEA